MSKVIDNIEDIASIDNHIGLSGITAYHLLQGNLAVDNTVTTQGFSTTLYTGNGSTQSINTGIDMSTQWGNDVSETFGGLVWGKDRNGASGHYLGDTIRGGSKFIMTNNTNTEGTSADFITSFNNNGFSIGSSVINDNTHGFASWNFQTTHRVSGTTNHGKAYTCHFNPFTGFTIVKYEGSGIAGHEIPHHLGRKLGFSTIKNITNIEHWNSDAYEANIRLILNLTNASLSVLTSTNELSVSLNNQGIWNNSTSNQYIMYGWANSYIDESNKLIGNYEVGVYQGTGASGNKVVTRGKPAWVIQKRIDAIGNWSIFNNMMGYNRLYPNLNNSENTGYTGTDHSIVSDGFIFNTSGADLNASGGQYLYIVVYDTNSNGGGSYYPRATDTSNLNISNAIIPYANGVDSNGTKITTLSKNETISGLTLTAGKNYVYSKNDGTYGVSKFEPQYGTYNGFGDYFDLNTNKWYSGVSVFSDDFSDGNSNGWTPSASTTVTETNGTISWYSTVTNYHDIHKTINIPNGRYRVIFKGLTGQNSNLLVGSDSTNYYNYIHTWDNKTDRYFDITISEPDGSIYIRIGGTNTNYVGTLSEIAIYPIKSDGTPDISNATEITTSRNYLNHIVYADHNGQPEYVEELPKVEYKDIIKANEYKGKNACTAWVNFDGTTTPPTIRDSYNVSSVVRTASGIYDVYFATPMDNVNYIVNEQNEGGQDVQRFISVNESNKFVNKVTIRTGYGTYLDNIGSIGISIFGGKN